MRAALAHVLLQDSVSEEVRVKLSPLIHKFTAHSLRCTVVSALAKQGVDSIKIKQQHGCDLVRDLRESWRAGYEALGKPISDPEDASESSQNENSSLTENDECHDLSDFPPAQAAGCQLDPECLENYDQWEFVVSKVAVEAMNGRMMPRQSNVNQACTSVALFR